MDIYRDRSFMVGKRLQMEHGRRIHQKMRRVTQVYYTTADLTGIYENNTLVEKQVLKEAPTALRMSGQIPAESSICTFRLRRQ